MIVRAAEPTDAAGIAALQVASWRDAYAAILDPAYLAGPIVVEKHALWGRRLAAPDSRLATIVALDGLDLTGFVCTIPRHDPRWGALVDNLHADPARRGGGIGTALLRAAAAWVAEADPASGLTLTVFEANTRARRFYERRGGRAVETLASEMPAARGARVVRMHWPSPRDVV